MTIMPIVRRRATTLFGGLILLVGAAGCLNLDVTNQNAPSVEDVFGRADNLEGAIAGAWRVFWGVAQGNRANGTFPVVHLSVLGNELTSADLSVMTVSQEPRIAIDNRDQGGWFNRKPWYDLNEAIAISRDALQSLDGGLKIGAVNTTTPNGADTPRARVFAKFLMGASQVYLGLLFDKAYATDETTNAQTFDNSFTPYAGVTANGVRLLREAIAEARSAPTFTLPAAWINGQAITRDQLVRIMYSYIVRAQVYMPRTVAERERVNWASVLAQLDSGITADFSQQADLAIAPTSSAYWQYSYLMTNGRTSTRLIGPADTSGAYQRWLATPTDQRNAILITTPDRRIHAATGNQAQGTYFAVLPTQTMTTVRGTYMHSRYRNVRFLRPPLNNYHQIGLITTMSVAEMRFIRAEALFRLGRRAEAAAILNTTRVAAGLRPVTETGPPAGADCVPRRDDGTCGDLFDALQYEKRIELFPTEAIIAYADQRGWGKLLRGTPIHMPVHGRELETIGSPYYTFGGGGDGSAP
ncbi:MAG: hypothetical protein MUF00_13095 [Gemmatimonadaceae bacterium]|jgi:hypothetical protein|nr:hypothetical protein [Gemmatimonadaceae bacterium]